MAADPVWKTKPVAQWSEEDARQVLTSSPWVKRATPALLPELTAEQRREGGATGGGKGVGFKGLAESNLDKEVRAARAGRMAPLAIRWESALPVRSAEVKARELGAPDWEGDAYAIAVYDVPNVKTNDKSLAADLKRAAVLKREGKKDLRPYGVVLMQEPGGLAVVVYLFSRSEAISKDDPQVEFVAQINRLSLAQYFFPAEMEFEGKLEL